MSFNQSLDRLLSQARELQRNVNEAMNKTTEQMQPLIKESLHNAQELQGTLSKHVTELSATAGDQAQKAAGYLQEYSKLGAEVAQKSADQARQTVAQMAEYSKKVVDSLSASAQRGSTKPDDEHPTV